jgi:hypothetical protein
VPFAISAADDASPDIAQPSMPLLVVATPPLPAPDPPAAAAVVPPLAAAASRCSLVSWALRELEKASRQDRAADRTSAQQ